VGIEHHNIIWLNTRAFPVNKVQVNNPELSIKYRCRRVCTLPRLAFSSSLRAESEGVVGLEVGVASEESSARGLVVCVSVRVGAGVLEVVVELDTVGRASLSGVVAARAAVGGILCRSHMSCHVHSASKMKDLR
jgi:hypothetical protein